MRTCPLCVAGLSILLGAGALTAYNAATSRAAAVEAKASTALAATAGTAASADAPAGTFQLDASHTSVVFKIQRIGGAPFYGRFDKSAGSITLDADVAKSSLEVNIPTDSINSNSSGRDRHLKSNDFFSAAEFPNLSFKSKSFKKLSDTTYEVAGELSLRGKTLPLTVKLTQTGTGPARGGGTQVGFESTFTIKRSDFGMTYLSQGLGDEVTVMLGLEGVQK